MAQKNLGKPYVNSPTGGFRFPFFIFLLAGLFILFTISSSKAAEEDKVSYRLKWLKNISTIGDLYAEETGLFREAGLSVTIKEGGPERDAIKELELGYAHFGVASADQVIRASAKGSPVMVIAQLFQINPLQWIYHEDEPPIEDIKSLKGKTIGITFGGNDETIMRTLLQTGGLSEKDVRLFSVRYDYTPFYTRTVSLWPVYRNAQAVILSEKLKSSGIGVRYLDPDRLGVRFVANSVVTSAQLYKTNPGMVRRFVKALLKGWEESIKPVNREKAIQILQTYDRDTPIGILEKQLAVTQTMVNPDGNIAIGSIDRAAWRQTEHIMREQKQIPRKVDVEGILRGVDDRSDP